MHNTVSAKFAKGVLLLSLALLLIPVLGGCASGPNSSSSSAGGVPASSASGSTASTNHLLQFAITLNDNGVFDATQGLYAVAFNSFDELIDVSSSDKFTDFVVYDGNNLVWYSRQTSSTNQSFIYVAVATVTQALSFTPDRRTMLITFDTSDASSALNQFIKSQQFTCVPVTTDRTGYLGRIIDTLGPGPDLSHDTLYTITVDKALGAISPLPASYPDDDLNDWIVLPDVAGTFPYVNYDIKSFTVTAK
jgi:hypothetical protein